MLVKNDVSDADRKGLVTDIEKKFGKLNKEDLWGIRDLAYPISHQDKAFYAHFEFESEPDKISDLDKSLRLNEDIIRYLLIRSNPPKKAKKAAKKEIKEEEKKED